ncbi:STE3-like pheromone receptor, partial [Gloeophyllum trabeum ATCC 11539]
DPTYPLFPVFSFLGFILALTPLSWHLQAWNAGTCLYMLWAGLGSLNMFVNAVVWDGRIDNIAPVWCDISTKFFIGAGVGIPAASLCIVRRLYLLSSIRSVNMTKQDKKRAVIADLAIGLGIPLLIMILRELFFVSCHRFDILQDIGCQPATYNTLPAYFLLFMWPPLLGCISFVYAALSLRNFFIRRIQFSQFATSAQAMNASRYLRLMLLACCEICCTIPIGIYSIYIDNKGVPIAPWVSWSDTHYNFSRVGQVPALIWMNDPSYYTSVQLSRWIFPVCCIIFFALFGFAEEARRHYSMLFWWIAKRFGLKPPAKKLQATLP